MCNILKASDPHSGGLVIISLKQIIFQSKDSPNYFLRIDINLKFIFLKGYRDVTQLSLFDLLDNRFLKVSQGISLLPPIFYSVLI